MTKHLPLIVLPWCEEYNDERKYTRQSIGNAKTIALVDKSISGAWSFFIYDSGAQGIDKYWERNLFTLPAEAMYYCDKILKELGYQFVSEERAEKIMLLL